MKQVCLISCVKSKKLGKHKAIDLYTGQLFDGHLRYAKSKNFLDNDIYILSAKHGLLNSDTVIEPYEKTLNNMKKSERNIWAKKVWKDLVKNFDLQNTEFLILAGKNYYQDLIPYLPNYVLPKELKNLPLGKRVQKLNQLAPKVK